MLALFGVFFNSCSNTEDVNVRLLREHAEKTSIACDEYFSSVNDFALSGGDDVSKIALSANLRHLVDELSWMNAAIFTVVNKDVAVKKIEQPGNNDFAMFLKISNFDKFSEPEMKEFLTGTVQNECLKWSKFAEYSDSQIVGYYSLAPINAKTSSELVCDAVKVEAKKQKIYGSIKVEQCDAQFSEGVWGLAVGLNDWVDWIDLDNPPSGEEAGNLIFDQPLGLLVEGFRNSDVNPSEFGRIIFIFFRDAESTVYEIIPEDLEVTLDSDNKQQALLELREKIVITGIK